MDQSTRCECEHRGESMILRKEPSRCYVRKQSCALHGSSRASTKAVDGTVKNETDKKVPVHDVQKHQPLLDATAEQRRSNPSLSFHVCKPQALIVRNGGSSGAADKERKSPLPASARPCPRIRVNAAWSSLPLGQRGCNSFSPRAPNKKEIKTTRTLCRLHGQGTCWRLLSCTHVLGWSPRLT